MKIFVGIDPGKTAGYAELYIQDENDDIPGELVEIVSAELMSELSTRYDPRKRSIYQACRRIITLILDYGQCVSIAVEDIRHQNKKVGGTTFSTAKDVGVLHGFLGTQDIEVREYSVTQHLRLTVGNDVMLGGKQSEIYQQLRIALEDKYTEDKLKAANCRNDHKRMALSVATAHAIQEGAISW